MTFFCQDFQSQEECEIAGGKAYDYCTETQNNRGKFKPGH